MNEEFSFMKEKIKEKPFYRKRWMQILCITIVAAVLFGVISAFIFTRMYDWLENRQDQENIQDIEIPKDQPEEPVPEDVDAENKAEPETEQVFVEAELTLEEYKDLFRQMRAVARKAAKSLSNCYSSQQ